MAQFPDILDEALRQRLTALGVRPDDVEERFVRGTGAGGQKINKTSSTVWLRHGPTGVEARCQAERSQVVNRIQAWWELAEKLSQRRAAAAAQRQHEHQAERRRRRQKSRAQKARMVDDKKHRGRIKQHRRNTHDW